MSELSAEQKLNYLLSLVVSLDFMAERGLLTNEKTHQATQFVLKKIRKSSDEPNAEPNSSKER